MSPEDLADRLGIPTGMREALGEVRALAAGLSEDLRKGQINGATPQELAQAHFILSFLAEVLAPTMAVMACANDVCERAIDDRTVHDMIHENNRLHWEVLQDTHDFLLGVIEGIDAPAINQRLRDLQAQAGVLLRQAMKESYE